MLQNKCFAYIDFEANIGIWQKDFPLPKQAFEQDEIKMESQQELNEVSTLFIHLLQNAQGFNNIKIDES